VLESIAWVVYVVPVLVAFLWPARPRPAATPSSPGAAPGTPSNPETHENVRA
jgi:high-affinity iron transporter